jgi:outer membrane assembly lipoprotein YfiO
MLRVTTYTVVLFVALLSWCCPQGQSPASGNNVKQSDDALFTQAMKAIKNSNYSEARTLLEALITSHPDSHYVPQAKLSIGDTWYAEGNLKRAEMEYQDFVTFFPNRPEVAETKLKVDSIQKRQK